MFKKIVRRYALPCMRSVSRISLEIELEKQFKRLKPGIVLDVGSGPSPYKNKIPYTRFMRLDIDKKSKPDICCDVHDIKWKSNYFDTVIATQILEHCRSPERVIKEIHRILKRGGVCILSTCFFYEYHPFPKDYYRFTQDSLNYLFRGFRKAEIHPYGNRLQVIWQILNTGKMRILLSILLINPVFARILARINFRETKFPCGFVVYAKK